jgi:hypothetical protein
MNNNNRNSSCRQTGNDLIWRTANLNHISRKQAHINSDKEISLYRPTHMIEYKHYVP